MPAPPGPGRWLGARRPRRERRHRRGVDALADAGVDADTTVVVTATQFLDPLLMPDIRDAISSAARVVVTTDDPVALDLFGLDWPVVAYPASVDPVAVDCGTTDVRAGERLGVMDRGFLVSASPTVLPALSATGWRPMSSPTQRGAVTGRLRRPAGLDERADPRRGHGRTGAAGDGAHESVVWYVPTLDDLQGSGRG